ncbi:hypothetical protein ACN42_g2080 [Penicillium freii]|uniref:Alanine racemase N-terminal domain-containing protein n=1 Tax=Penicillium freii TaxID=48697 RepID=A0A101MQP8_PENFR|nr:hypothetical protein ACN42_g2080 [Penicillium freii]
MASQEELKDFYVGQDVGSVPKPALVLDVAIIRRHCETMIRTVKELDVGFRAHVKSHKKTEIAEMQVGDKTLDGNFIASTMLEIEGLVPLLKKLQSERHRVNVLYGIPLVPSQVARLAKIALEVGRESISLSSRSIRAIIELDYHPPALNKEGLLEKLVNFEKQGYVKLLGVYSHSSLSYAGTTPQEAMKHLINEIDSCKEAVQLHSQFFPQKQLVISVGATPQALSSQNLLQKGEVGPEATTLRDLLRAPFGSDLDAKVKVELHAGVYPLLDMQQLSTKASMQLKSPEEEIAVSVLAEVCSVYSSGERSQPRLSLRPGHWHWEGSHVLAILAGRNCLLGDNRLPTRSHA